MEELRKQIEEAIKKNPAEARKRFLSKKGELTLLLRSLKDRPLEERKKISQEANYLRHLLMDQKSEVKKESFDFTIPGQEVERGSWHPLTLTIRECVRIMTGMGFQVFQSRELEDSSYNFDQLNFPPDHPARDMQDTFFVGKDKVLRTHTSAAQIRYLEEYGVPARIICHGRVFRNEATDNSHHFNFYQMEALLIDKDINVGHLKAVMTEFLSSFFGEKLDIRLRPSYFPFVEPGFEVDARAKGGKWIELCGAGMVHPNVFSKPGYSGFAFGFGLERLAMLKYQIDDIRLFYDNDIRFLKQF